MINILQYLLPALENKEIGYGKKIAEVKWVYFGKNTLYLGKLNGIKSHAAMSIKLTKVRPILVYKLLLRYVLEFQLLNPIQPLCGLVLFFYTVKIVKRLV